MKRRSIVVLMVVAGFALQAVAYVLLAAPLGIPTAVRFSNPRVPFAPALFIVGVMLVFLSAVVYEVMRDRGDRTHEER